MKLLAHIPKWLKNKYLLAGVFFVVWILFLDPKDVMSGIERRQHLNKLENTEKNLDEMIKETTKELGLLKNNAKSIEKYAREKYRMKKDNEELFIIEDEVINE